MAKNHKYHQARVEAESQLEPSLLIDIAKHVAFAMQKQGISVQGEGDHTLHLVVKNVFRVTQLEFYVNVEPRGFRTHIETDIVRYLTNQVKVLAFIPLGPKEMLGYKQYRNYMQSLANAVIAADPSAQTALIEVAAA